MAIRYVDGANGNNSWNGLSPVFTGGTNGPKATLNGVEDTPVAAGDIVHVRPGTYRETLTVDISATVGNPIEYRGDYLGRIWENPSNGVVRVTGSDNDRSATRANCIVASSKNYRTFQGFLFDTTTGAAIDNNGGTNWIVSNCYASPPANNAIVFDNRGASQANCTYQNCFVNGKGDGNACIGFNHSSNLDNAGHVVQDCILLGAAAGVRIDRVGGVTVKNSTFLFRINNGVQAPFALNVGQVITVNNCIFQGCMTGISGAATGTVTEDYNTFFACTSNRANTAVGANSLTYPALLDSRWFFQMVYAGAGAYNPLQIASPFDLSSQSQLINVAGTNPPATDIRGTAVQNSQREWGALEYDSTLSIKARQAGMIGGGGMIIS